MKRLELEGKLNTMDGLWLRSRCPLDPRMPNWPGVWEALFYVEDSHELREKLKTCGIDGTKPIKVKLVVEQDFVLCGKVAGGVDGLTRDELVARLRSARLYGSADPPPCWQCMLEEGHHGPCEDFRGMRFDPK